MTTLFQIEPTTNTLVIQPDTIKDYSEQSEETWRDWAQNNVGVNILFEGENKPFTESLDFNTIHFPRDGIVTFSNWFLEGATWTFSNRHFICSSMFLPKLVLESGIIRFNQCIFNCKEINFKDTKAKTKSQIMFDRCDFQPNDDIVPRSKLFFGQPIFVDSTLLFNQVTFKRNEILIPLARFENGVFGFYESVFLETTVTMGGCYFDCQVIFHSTRQTGAEKLLTIANSSVTKGLSIVSDQPFSNLPSLAGSVITGAPHLDFQCNKTYPFLKKDWTSKEWLDARREEVASARKLKELAEAGKNHRLALEMNAHEMRASRALTKMGFSLFLDLTYAATSNYGQSITRPLCSLFCLLFGFVVIYMMSAKCTVTIDVFKNALSFSTYQMFAWIPGTKLTIDQTVTALYGGKAMIPWWISMLNLVQSLLTAPLLFLLGLGLRNRFRL